MNFLNVEQLEKSYGEKLLFSNVSFGIEKGQKTALIAQNGRGKSTLLQIICGKVLADKGNVTIRKDIKVEYLAQSPHFEYGQSVIEHLLSADTPICKLLKKYEELNLRHSMSQGEAYSEEENKQWEEVLLQMDKLSAWNYEEKLKEVLSYLKIKNLDQDCSLLSGGEQKKLALAKIILSDADLLLLDEPTNHLDIDMIEWLEAYLGKQNTAILLVSHDRAFINNVCDDIIEIDKNQAYFYKGNYEYFLEKKAQRESFEAAELEKNKNLYRRELEWIRRMPSARGTKSKARKDAFEDLKSKISTQKPQAKIELNINSQRLGNKILEINNISKSYGEKKIIDDFSYNFKRGEKIGIVGPNGVGKSSFLNILCGREKADSGSIVVGQTIRFGYYEQKGLLDSSDKRLIEIIKEEAEIFENERGNKMSASQFLNYFLFDPSTQYNYFCNLSGGEKRRLYLLKTLVSQPNFLILDEPTNDLDVFTLMALENFLLTYDGCVLMVSHDRGFLEHIADHLFIFEGDGKIKDFYGNYSEYKLSKKQAENTLKASKEEKPSGKTFATENKENTKKKLSYKEQREVEEIEAKLPKLSERKTEIENLLSEPPSELDFNALTDISKELEDLKAEIDSLEMRWLELNP